MRLGVWVLPFGLALGCSSDPLDPSAAGAPTSDPTGSPTTVPTGVPTSDPPAGDFAPARAYAPGPYGHGVGAVIENLEFLGWRDPVASGYDPEHLTTVSLADFYDPNGSSTELIVLNASAVWCVVCQAELRDMNEAGTYAAYRARGVEVVGTLFQDAAGDPARPSDLELWGKAPARSIGFPLVLDPGLKMGIYFSSDATPLNLLIDARTMRILDVMMGYDSTPGSGLWGIVDRELAQRGR